jgi:hypothetical protein
MGKRIPGKALVDLSALDTRTIQTSGNHNPHRPILSHCPMEGAWQPNDISPYVVHHYTGTLEHYLFRQDGRNQRTQATYNERQYNDASENDSIRFWIQGFVNAVGHDLAQELLEGVGDIKANRFPVSKHEKLSSIL